MKWNKTQSAIVPPLFILQKPPFYCSHGGEWIVSHDAIQDAFVSIAKDVRFHVSCEQTHVLPPFIQVFLSMG